MYHARRATVEAITDVDAATGTNPKTCPKGQGYLKLFEKFTNSNPSQGILRSTPEVIDYFNVRTEAIFAGDELQLVQLIDETWVVRCVCPVGSSSSSSSGNCQQFVCVDVWEQQYSNDGDENSTVPDPLPVFDYPFPNVVQIRSFVSDCTVTAGVRILNIIVAYCENAGEYRGVNSNQLVGEIEDYLNNLYPVPPGDSGFHLLSGTVSCQLSLETDPDTGHATWETCGDPPNPVAEPALYNEWVQCCIVQGTCGEDEESDSDSDAPEEPCVDERDSGLASPDAVRDQMECCTDEGTI